MDSRNGWANLQTVEWKTLTGEVFMLGALKDLILLVVSAVELSRWRTFVI